MTIRTAKTLAELSTPEHCASMSGYDFMRGILEGQVAAPPIRETLGFRVHSVEPGRVVFAGTPRFAALNPMGMTHGGWFGAILDSCMACAVMASLPKGRGYTTMEYKINILRAAPPDGQELHAIGEALLVGRRSGAAEGKLIGAEDGKLYAFGTTTCHVFDF